MKTVLSLTEELLSQGLESDLTRIILTVQSVVNIINNKLRSLHSDSEEQLVSWANQVWLDKLIKSRYVIISLISAGLMVVDVRTVKMIVTRVATSKLEVESEHQGDLLVALDPLTVGRALHQAASSSFAVWSRDGWEGESVMCAGLVTYGLVTRLLIGGEAGTSLYQLDPGLGQLVRAELKTSEASQVLSIPADSPGTDR